MILWWNRSLLVSIAYFSKCMHFLCLSIIIIAAQCSKPKLIYSLVWNSICENKSAKQTKGNVNESIPTRQRQLWMLSRYEAASLNSLFVIPQAKQPGIREWHTVIDLMTICYKQGPTKSTAVKTVSSCVIDHLP